MHINNKSYESCLAEPQRTSVYTLLVWDFKETLLSAGARSVLENTSESEALAQLVVLAQHAQNPECDSQLCISQVCSGHMQSQNSRLEVQGHSWLHIEFEASRVSGGLCHQNKYINKPEKMAVDSAPKSSFLAAL